MKSGIMPQLVLPRHLVHSDSRLVASDGVSAVEYRSAGEFYGKELHVTVPMFVAVLSGTKVVHLAESDMSVGSGCGLFCMGGTFAYSEMFADESPFQSVIFFLSPERLRRFAEAHGIAPATETQNPVLRIPFTPLMHNAVQSSLPYFKHAMAESSAAAGLKIEELLLAIADSPQGAEFLAMVQDSCSRKTDLAEFMLANFHKPLLVEEFAALSGRSLSAFKRECAEVLGDSPKRWINAKRLEKARAMLMRGEHNVTEVCFNCGFENPSYFATLFKASFGVSPSKIKRI